MSYGALKGAIHEAELMGLNDKESLSWPGHPFPAVLPQEKLNPFSLSYPMVVLHSSPVAAERSLLLGC